MTPAERTERFDLDQKLRGWLLAEDPEEPNDAHENLFHRWLTARWRANAIFKIGSVLVDQAVLQTHFACVADRCAPWLNPRRFRCCCADIIVPLTPAEKRRLGRMRKALTFHLFRLEPRLISSLLSHNGRSPSFWLDQDRNSLYRHEERCVFSKMDKSGRIRCHLHLVAKKENVELSELQPIPCRLFPLVLIRPDEGGVLLTVLNQGNYRFLDSLAPRRFPCLCDRSLPRLVQSMSKTLDWMFGKGFARALAKTARRLPGQVGRG